MDDSNIAADASSQIAVSQKKMPSGDDCSKNRVAKFSQLTAVDQVCLHFETPKPQEPKSLALYGFEAARTSPAEESTDAKTIVEQVKLAAERQIEKTLAQQHEELLANIRVLITNQVSACFAVVEKNETSSLKEAKTGPTLPSSLNHGNANENGTSPRSRSKSGSSLQRSTSTVSGTTRKQNSFEEEVLGLATAKCRRASSVSDIVDEFKAAQMNPEGSCLRHTLHTPQFELFMGIAVCSNAIFIGWEIDYMTAHEESAVAPLHFTIISYSYTVLFLIELALRLLDNFWGFIWGSDGKTLAWNYLDIAIVAASLAEVGLDIITYQGTSSGHIELSNLRIIRMIRVFRLIRLLRVARFVRFVRALRTLVYSIICTLKSVFWAMVLMVTIIYVFAILFTQATISYRSQSDLTPNVPRLYEHWGTIGRSMLSLFMSISGGVSWTEVIEPLSSISFVWQYLFLVYIYFTYFAILNVVTGIFCQAAYESNSEDHDSMLQTVLRHKQLYTQRFKEIFEQIDDDASGRITLEEFMVRMEDDIVTDYFASLDLQCEDALYLFDLFDDAETDGIQVEEFVMGCLRLKGSARSSDVIRLLHENKLIMTRLETLFNHFEIFTGENRGKTRGTTKHTVFMETVAKELSKTVDINRLPSEPRSPRGRNTT